MSESTFQGFWTIIDIKGAQAPTSRENASLFVQNWFGSDWVTLVGGTGPTIGTAPFQAFTFSLDEKKWFNVELSKLIPQTKGSKPVCCVDGENALVYQFSGQALVSKMNQGLGVCTTDLNHLRMESSTSAKV